MGLQQVYQSDVWLRRARVEEGSGFLGVLVPFGCRDRVTSLDQGIHHHLPWSRSCAFLFRALGRSSGSCDDL